MAIEPIQLDEFGAMLIPLEEREPMTHEYMVGYHGGCTSRGFSGFYSQYHSSTHNCLLCLGCHLRIIVSNQFLPLIITPEVFEPLRKHLVEQIKGRQGRNRQINNAILRTAIIGGS